MDRSVARFRIVGPSRRFVRGLGVAAIAMLAATACASEIHRPIRPEYDLRDPSATRRLTAISTVERTGDRTQVPALIELLDDEDESVRMAAGAALKGLTGHDTGYRAFAPPEERRAAGRDVARVVAPGIGNGRSRVEVPPPGGAGTPRGYPCPHPLTSPSSRTCRRTRGSSSSSACWRGRARCSPGFADDDCDRIELAVVEGFTNIIRHGYGGRTDQRIEIRLAAPPGRFRMEFVDWAKFVDPSMIASRPLDQVRPGGSAST